jgi:YD repeat-containing protein
MTHLPIPTTILRGALVLATLAAPTWAQTIPGIPITPPCPPNSSCVPSTPPVTPPGTCGPGPGGATCGAGGPASSGSATGINVGAGNPINIINGNKYQREVDMAALPGVLGLEIVRHYNSVYSGPNGSTNLLGRGWKLSYETDLHVTAATLQVVQADGTRIIFSRDAGNPSLCASGDPADGSIEIVRRTRNEEYVWTMADGRQLSFDSRGKLVQIRHPGGEFVSLVYDRSGLLLSVTDPQGRSLRLNYRGRSGTAFAGVESIDSPLGRFAYRHGSTPPKESATGTRELLANLAGVRYPGNAGGRDYHYEDTARPTYLTGISLLDGQRSERYATYRYGADGKAISTSHAGGSQKVELDFSAPGRTTLTNSLGQKTVYRHAVLAGQYRLLEVRGPGCAQCGETNLRYSYDEAGRLLETTKLDRNGQPLRGLRTEYDARSRPLRIHQFAYVDGKPARAELVTRYEYGQFDSPTLIARPSVVKGKEAVVRIVYNAAAQPFSLMLSGWAPDKAGDGAALPIARTTRYGYRNINGRSLLARIDAPLPNGKTATPADSDVTEIEWDSKGNAPVALTRPGMARSSVAYDSMWRIVQVRSDSGATTTFGYDTRGRRHTVAAGDIVWQTRFDVLDRVTETGYTKDGAYTATSRRGADLGGLNVWSVSQAGQWRRQLFDTEGRLRETSLRAGAQAQVRQFAYDEANRLSAVSDANGGVRRIVWNAADQAEARIDALGRVQRYRYDGAGQLAEVIDAANTRQAQATDIERDALGLVTGVTAANGARTRYLVDDFGRTLRMDSPDSGVGTRSYDEADRLTAMRDALGNGAEYRYDVAGRIVRQSVTGPGLAQPIVTSWNYTGALLTAVEHPVQSERYAYDAGGRLLAKTITLRRQGGAPVVTTVRYQYGADGRTEAVTLADGSLLQVRRDAMHAVVALERQRIVTPWLRWMLPAERLASGIRRDLTGISAFEYGNGIGARFERSASGALARVAYAPASGTAKGGATTAATAGAGLAALLGIGPAHAAPASGATPLTLRFDTQAVLDYRYLWDVQGNLLRLADAAGVRDHAYDAHDRLIVEARRDSAAGLRQVALDGASDNRYFYDKGGNRILSQRLLSGA